MRNTPHLALRRRELVEEVRASLGGLVFDERDPGRKLVIMEAGGTIVE